VPPPRLERRGFRRGLLVKRLVCLIAIVCVARGIANAQSSDAAPSDVPISGDRAAVAEAVMNVVTEVKLCGLATEKSQNGEVRSLCRSLSAENARMALAGLQLAQRLGATDVKLAPAPDTPAVLDALGQYSGKAFDREFLFAAIKNDEDGEHSMRYAVEVTTDAAVKRYLSAVLPRVETHLDLAESVLRRVSESMP